ncbi:MAG: alpha/beta hydrolase, partial [Planctomyces sp.]|nr:alpha/beta hydrolase [Planctomyces sp.]
GTNDKVIDFASGEKLFAAANEPKRFVRLEDIEHNNWITEEYISELDNFLSSLPLLEQK